MKPADNHPKIASSGFEPARNRTADRRALAAKEIGAATDRIPNVRDLQNSGTALPHRTRVRRDKVDRIRRQIATGTYRIDPVRIATRILQESLLNELATARYEGVRSGPRSSFLNFRYNPRN